jgi:hypothetical protein
MRSGRWVAFCWKLLLMALLFESFLQQRCWWGSYMGWFWCFHVFFVADAVRVPTLVDFGASEGVVRGFGAVRVELCARLKSLSFADAVSRPFRKSMLERDSKNEKGCHKKDTV